MALKFSASVRNARLDAIETNIGASAVLKIRSGSAPTNITDAVLGNITATLTPVETVKIIPGIYFYDVKAVRSTGSVNSLTQGKITFVPDITKAII